MPLLATRSSDSAIEKARNEINILAVARGLTFSRWQLHVADDATTTMTVLYGVYEGLEANEAHEADRIEIYRRLLFASAEAAEIGTKEEKRYLEEIKLHLEAMPVMPHAGN
jgi:putative ubiquitin-RnfH superfamily antitoxin RatB of RatAB toxin-antitoxin module